MLLQYMFSTLAHEHNLPMKSALDNFSSIQTYGRHAEEFSDAPYAANTDAFVTSHS